MDQTFKMFFNRRYWDMYENMPNSSIRALLTIDTALPDCYYSSHTMRGRAVEARRAHNPEVAGSSPVPAIHGDIAQPARAMHS